MNSVLYVIGHVAHISDPSFNPTYRDSVFTVCPLPDSTGSCTIGSRYRIWPCGPCFDIIERGQILSEVIAENWAPAGHVETVSLENFSEEYACSYRDVTCVIAQPPPRIGSLLLPEGIRADTNFLRVNCEVAAPSLLWRDISRRLREIKGPLSSERDVRAYVRQFGYEGVVYPEKKVDPLVHLCASAVLREGRVIPVAFRSSKKGGVFVMGWLFVSRIHLDGRGGGVLSCSAVTIHNTESLDNFGWNWEVVLACGDGVIENTDSIGVVMSMEKGEWM